jgi:hypothetical protein
VDDRIIHVTEYKQDGVKRRPANELAGSVLTGHIITHISF